MKYQIYLNKEVSDQVNTMALEANTTPAHLIKILVEQLMPEISKSLEVIMNEVNKQVENSLAKR